MKPILSTIPGLLCLSLLCNPALGQSFDDAWDDAWGEDDIAEREPWLTGFVEQSVGSRWSDSRHHNDISLQDSRMRLEYDAAIGDWSLAGKADLYYDGVLHDWRDQVRELSAQTSFGPVDIKAGRQITTHFFNAAIATKVSIKQLDKAPTNATSGLSKRSSP